MSDPSSLADWPDAGPIAALEGLDSKAGLARIGGKPALYLKLLRQFLDLESMPAQIADHLAGGDRLAAERLAHTLNGSAAGLGIVAVQSAALQLELALRGEAVATTLLAGLETVLADSLARLRLALPPESAASPSLGGSFASPEKVGELMAQMDARLGEFDVAALELFEANRDLFGGLLSAAEFSVLQAQVGNFAFAEARVTLRQAAAERAIPLA